MATGARRHLEDREAAVDLTDSVVIDLTDPTVIDLTDSRPPSEPPNAAALRALLRERISTTPDWRHSVTHLAVMGAATLLGLTLVEIGYWEATAVGIVVLALVSASMVSSQHECAHWALFRTRWLNDALGLLIGFVTLIPFAGYRVFHMHHHAHTHEPRDSEPITVARSMWTWVAYLAGSTHYVRGVSTQWLGRALTSRNRRTRVVGVLSVLCAVASVATAVAVAVLDLRLLLVGWALPLVVGGFIGGFLTIPEHYGCGYGPASSVVTTRTVTSNGLGRFLTWNANYHAEHHLAPTVPTAHLGELHELVKGQLVHDETGYFHYHRQLVSDLWHKRYVSDPPWETPS